MPNNHDKTVSDRNAALTTEANAKMTQLHGLLSAGLRSHLKFPDIPSKTNLSYLDLLVTSFECVGLGCGSFYHQYFSLDKHTEVSCPPYLPNVLPLYTDSSRIHDFQ